MRRTAHKRRRGESGSALIPVLALILACSMIVTAVIAMSQLNVYTMTAHVKQQKSMYLCEGAANRIQWLVAAERNLNPNVSYDTFDYADYEYDRFLPDGVEHEMDYHGTPVKFRITDAAAGLDFSRTLRLNTLNRLKMNTATDAEFTDTMTTLDNQLRDYTDADDVVTDDGREESEFQLLGQLPLPRNAEFQYREELFFIPEFTALFPPDENGRLSAIRMIPPESLRRITVTTTVQQSGGQRPGFGMQQQQQPQRRTQTTNLFVTQPNIFGAPDLYLSNVFDLEESQLYDIREGIRQYQTERTPLEDVIDSTVFQALKNRSYLAWTPGRAYTVIVTPANGEPAKRLAFTWINPDQISGPEDGIVRYLEWMFF